MGIFGRKSQNSTKDIASVCDVNILKYIGSWYEIARFPHVFEKGLENVTATYNLKSDGKIEVITYIDDKNFNYCRGNAIKYISRAGKKNPEKEIEDLEKAEWYIHHEIERLQKLKEQKIKDQKIKEGE